jgi:DNA-binding transcriptional ArsR family regulator
MNATTSTARSPGRPAEIGLDRVTGALSDRTRRGLLRLVSSEEQTAGSLAAAFPQISRPAVSQHLRVLHDAGLVTVRADGSRRLYRARNESLAPVSRFIDDLWGDGVQRLGRAPEAAEGGGR